MEVTVSLGISWESEVSDGPKDQPTRRKWGDWEGRASLQERTSSQAQTRIHTFPEESSESQDGFTHSPHHAPSTSRGDSTPGQTEGCGGSAHTQPRSLSSLLNNLWESNLSPGTLDDVWRA